MLPLAVARIQRATAFFFYSLLYVKIERDKELKSYRFLLSQE
jgi:hypothetical protein